MLKPKNAAEIEVKVRASIENMRKQLEIGSVLVEIATQMKGQAITRRLSSKLAERFPGLTVYYRDEFNQLNIRVWGGGITYDNCLSFFLGYKDRKPRIDPDALAEEVGINRLPDKIKQYEAALSGIPALVAEWNKTLATLETINAKAAQTGLEYLF